jgi:hypothetical protein
MVLPGYYGDERGAKREILRWVRGDYVQTICDRLVITNEHNARSVDHGVQVPAHVWETAAGQIDEGDWRDGYFTASRYDSIFGDEQTAVHGAQFCREDLAAKLPTAPEKWMAARDALALVAPHYRTGLEAQRAITDRAAIGRVAAKCETRQTDSNTVNSGGQKFAGKVHQDSDYLVSPKFWETFKDQKKREKADWVAGDFVTHDQEFTGASGSFQNTYERLCGTQFSEAGIRAMVPAQDAASAALSSRASQSTDVPQEATPGAPASTKPSAPKLAVSDSALTEWWALFNKYNPDATEPQTLAAVTAMFPRNDIARPRIRTLRGSRKPGPKAKAAE